MVTIEEEIMWRESVRKDVFATLQEWWQGDYVLDKRDLKA